MSLALTYDPVLSRVRISGTTYLNANPFFETDTSNWSALSGTVARSTAQFHQGVASLLLTPDGVSVAQARAELVPVSAGRVYRASVWVRCAVSRQVRLTVDWHDGGGTFLSSSNVDTSVAATTWTLLSSTPTAPASAAQARLVVQLTPTPLTSHLLHIDEAMIEPYPVTVERSTNGVTWVTVRGGTALVPASGSISLDDYEFAPDVANYYRLAAQAGYGTVLNANPFFETDTSNWTSQSATIARSTVRAHEGVASLLITPDGVAASGGALGDRAAVTVGTSYLASLWVYATSSMQVGPAVDWWTATSGGSFISTTFVGPVTVPAGVWTLVAGVVTAPATAVAGQIRARHAGTPTAGMTWWADEVMLSAAGIVPTLDGVWLKSLARPFLNRKVRVTDWSDVERSSRSGVFPIVGRSYPVAVTDLHGSRQWTLDVVTQDAQDAANLDLLISTGEVQFVHVPAAERIPGGYVALGDTSERRPQPRSQRRVFSLPLTECAAPAADVIPAVGTCQTVINTYATCADVLAAHPTCADLLQLVGSAADVVVP